MTRYLCINPNNILKSISDKLYVYKFDPNESGISTDFNTKLVTIGTRTIQYYSDLPMSMTEKCDHTLISLSGTFELKPRIEINGVYYYSRYNERDIELSPLELYNDRTTQDKYVYNEAKTKKLDLIIGHIVYEKFNSFTRGVVEPTSDYCYYDRASETYYEFIGNGLLPIDRPLVGVSLDKGYCIDPSFYTETGDNIELSDRFLYKEIIRDKFYIYQNSEFKEVNPIGVEDVEGSKEEVYYDSNMDYYLYTPSNIIQVNVLTGEYNEGSISNTWSSGIEYDPSIVYQVADKDYYRLQDKGYHKSYVIPCYMSDNKIYHDEELTQEIEPEEDIPYHDSISTKYYKWKDIPNRILTCHKGYKDDNNFYDLLHSIYSPVSGDLYEDTSTGRYYMYGGSHYSQVHVVQGYLHEGKLYSDPTLLTEISMVEGNLYHDILEDSYFEYNLYQWIELTQFEGYLSNGNFYDLNGNLLSPIDNGLYIYEGTYYLYLNYKYVKIDLVNCYYSEGKFVKSPPNSVFLFSCIISDQCVEPKYEVMETGEYCIVPPEMNIDEYIDFINKSSLTIFLEKSGDEEHLQVANIFGINLKDTTPVHYFNDTNPYGRDNKVLLDEKMQIATWVRTLREKYPSLLFYTDPNDRVKISTHSNEFLYYQAKLFSDDSQYTTPLRYNDYRYGRVRNYEISIFVRYESPDMVTFLNRRNEFLMHKFLNPVQDIEINLENGDLIHIGVNWTRSIREEEPDKSVDQSERNIYTFITQCNLNGLLLERSDTPTSIEEVIANIYVTSTDNKAGM